MNFLALLLGLGLERALTRFFHLREFRWLDRLFDRLFARVDRTTPGSAVFTLALGALLLAAPVAIVSVLLASETSQVPWLVVALLVLLLSLGPRDLQEEVDDYCAAADAGRDEDVRRLTRELAEQSPAQDPEAQRHAIRRAIGIQANNRMFAVVFWFLLLGPAAPAGAWLFRVADLMRRRAVFTRPGSDVLAAARTVHGLLAWLPGRLVAGAFALAGSFEGARAAWRASPPLQMTFYERTDTLLGRVAEGAAQEVTAAPGATGARAVADPPMKLVWRTLWLIWYPAIALLTLNDWLR